MELFVDVLDMTLNIGLAQVVIKRQFLYINVLNIQFSSCAHRLSCFVYFTNHSIL